MAASEATAAAAAAAGHGSGGLPQFDPSWWPGQMVWMLIIFGVMFFLFAKVFVPRWAAPWTIARIASAAISARPAG